MSLPPPLAELADALVGVVSEVNRSSESTQRAIVDLAFDLGRTQQLGVREDERELFEQAVRLLALAAERCQALEWYPSSLAEDARAHTPPAGFYKLLGVNEARSGLAFLEALTGVRVDLTGLDEQLVRVHGDSIDFGPVPEGIPDSHWWWTWDGLSSRSAGS